MPKKALFPSLKDGGAEGIRTPDPHNAIQGKLISLFVFQTLYVVRRRLSPIRKIG